MRNEKGFGFSKVISSKGKAKVLEVLAISNELNVSEIIRRTSLNYSSVMKHLNHFVDLGFVQEKQFGRIRIFRYKIENIKARAFKNLIDLLNSD
jgi:DNA-binding transcriptional ArsR family regulator